LPTAGCELKSCKYNVKTIYFSSTLMISKNNLAISQTRLPNKANHVNTTGIKGHSFITEIEIHHLGPAL
jgi:hypothetical protein